MVGRHFGEAAVPEGECGPWPLCTSYIIPWHSPVKNGSEQGEALSPLFLNFA
jgi:hypothetical protein